MSEFKTCEECNGPTQFIECKSNPYAAEWYCEKCHRSYLAREPRRETIELEHERPKRRKSA